MLLGLRALLVLGLVPLLHATRKDNAVSLKLGQGSRLKGQTVRLVLDSSVQPQIASTSASSIANIDSCVESRLPRRISHAQCLTSGCLSLQGGGEDAALEAKPIYYQVLVLHRVPRKRRSKKAGRMRRNQYDFRLGTEVISVGCTCVRPGVVPQQ
ncbi:hypothetical protein FQN60_015990 [Etheostoma spectabile]|uniref:Uncharacterized protein n=1 Tax=Etheostoma spectabile TaxID=54343 RepID=A0A5J5CPQ3_9PERO|nr:hypothetical protein FQN60_015990 [Etheostoma spectabile]